MTDSVVQARRPRRNGVYWGDSLARAAKALHWRKNQVRERAKMQDGKLIAPGTIAKLWMGYVGGGPVEEYTATPVILLFQQPEVAGELKNHGIDPAEIVIPQEFRFKDEVRMPLLGRMAQLTDGVKRLDRGHFSYISARVWERALVDGGCFTKRHIGDLAQLALDQLRFIPGPGVDGIRAPDELYETIPLEFAYPSAYRE